MYYLAHKKYNYNLNKAFWLKRPLTIISLMSSNNLNKEFLLTQEKYNYILNRSTTKATTTVMGWKWLALFNYKTRNQFC